MDTYNRFGSISGCHNPRKRVIQYAAASRFYHRRLWNTGSPAFAGDDSKGAMEQIARRAIDGYATTTGSPP